MASETKSAALLQAAFTALKFALGLLHVGHHFLHDGHLLLHDADGVADLALKPVRRHCQVALDLLFHLWATWALVGEFGLIYHNRETILFTIDP